MIEFRSFDKPVAYEEARKLQLELVDQRAAELIPDTVLFLEHEPVITRGRGLQFTGKARQRHMPAPAALPVGIEFRECERGGDLTYHGPGQLVIYPICKVSDVAAFLRGLERALTEVLGARYGVAARGCADATGVWAGERKIASIGIAVRKWVTYHGAAINVTNELAPFHLISPCGFSPEVMTRLADLARPGTLEAARWRPPLEAALRPALEAALSERSAPAR